MSEPPNTLTAALRRSWRPLALAGTVIAALAVALTIAFAKPPSPVPLGGPVRVEQPRTDTGSRPPGTSQDAKPSQPPQSSQSPGGSQPSQSSQGFVGSRPSGDSKGETSKAEGDAGAGSRPVTRPAVQRTGAVPVPRPTLPAAGDDADEAEPGDADSDPVTTDEDDEEPQPVEPADGDDG